MGLPKCVWILRCEDLEASAWARIELDEVGLIVGIQHQINAGLHSPSARVVRRQAAAIEASVWRSSSAEPGPTCAPRAAFATGSVGLDRTTAGH